MAPSMMEKVGKGLAIEALLFHCEPMGRRACAVQGSVEHFYTPLCGADSSAAASTGYKEPRHAPAGNLQYSQYTVLQYECIN